MKKEEKEKSVKNAPLIFRPYKRDEYGRRTHCDFHIKCFDFLPYFFLSLWSLLNGAVGCITPTEEDIVLMDMDEECTVVVVCMVDEDMEALVVLGDHMEEEESIPLLELYKEPLWELHLAVK